MTSLLSNYRLVSREYSWGGGLYYTLFCILISTLRGGRETGPAHTQAFPQARRSTVTPKPRGCLYRGRHLPHLHCPSARAPGGGATPATASPHRFPWLGHVHHPDEQGGGDRRAQRLPLQHNVGTEHWASVNRWLTLTWSQWLGLCRHSDLGFRPKMTGERYFSRGWTKTMNELLNFLSANIYKVLLLGTRITLIILCDLYRHFDTVF